MYGIADEYCEEFVNGTALLGGRYNLKDWLDTLMPEDEAHTYIQSEKKKRNGRRARK